MERDAGLVKTGWPFRAGAALAGFGAALLDMAFPPVCLACGDAVGSPDGLCAPCWRQLMPIAPPFCPILGLPFETDMGAGAVSPAAIADPPPFGRARAAVGYTDLARQLVSKLKYADRPEIARFCARMMAAAGHELLDPDTVLVPVPLHKSRQRDRRYNQSAELARALSGLANLPLCTDLVIRHRRTAQQVGLSARARAKNVEGAFRADPRVLARLGGRRIVVIDDVLTTGATVCAVTLAIKRAGAETVDVLSFARVVFDADMTV